VGLLKIKFMGNMKRIILVSLLIAFGISASAQKFRVFNQLSLDYTFSQKHLSPDIQIGQALQIGTQFPVRFSAAVKFTGDIIKKGDIPNIDSKKDSYIMLTKANFSPSLSIPIGVEYGYRKLSLGVTVDIIGINFGKGLDSLNYTIEEAGTADLKGLETSPNRFNFIFSKSSNKALDATIYLAYTYNDSFTFRFGICKQDVLYQSFTTVKNQSKKFEKFGFDELKPFIGLRFNIEK
jgi:hypothetical protein